MAQRLEVRGAALLPGAAHGWLADPAVRAAPLARDGLVWVLFGPCDVIGWIAVDGGAPPDLALTRVRSL